MIYVDRHYAAWFTWLAVSLESSLNKHVSFKCLRKTTHTKYFRVKRPRKKKSLAIDYEINMITASLDDTNARATNHKIDRAGICGCGYATSTRTTLNQCATIRLNVVWWLNQIKIYTCPQQQTDPPVQLDQKTFDIRWYIVSLSHAEH